MIIRANDSRRSHHCELASIAVPVLALLVSALPACRGHSEPGSDAVGPTGAATTGTGGADASGGDGGSGVTGGAAGAPSIAGNATAGDTGGDDGGLGGASAGASPVGGAGGLGATVAGGAPATVAGGAPATGGANTGGTPAGLGGVFDPGPQQSSSPELDLLFVIDNSMSMFDKQALFAEAVPELVGRLINPHCVDADGASVEPPSGPDLPCPEGTERELPPVDDLHVGVITSSLGAHGGTICSPDEPSVWTPEKDDRAELIAPLRGLASYEDRGYLAWDPNGLASPPGSNDAAQFVADVAALVTSAGEIGCGYEAPLEAMYRFLIDPEPPVEILAGGIRGAVNATLLDQRATFLRPTSALAIVLLGDENDCSILDNSLGSLVGMTPQYLPRPTAACAADPNDLCCRSCALAEASPPDGCAALAEDAGCALPPYDHADDPLNLRCFQQKRRFGLDLLYPTERYVRGLTATTVLRDSDRAEVDNPLFAGGRDPSLVTVAALVGVPWQALAEPTSSADDLRYRSAAALHADDSWTALVGDLANQVPPLDPFMVESIDPRTELPPSPLTGLAPEPVTAPGGASPVNGHEYTVADRNDLQFACTFPLASPRVCTEGMETPCECVPDSPNTATKPVCQEPGSTSSGVTQYSARAYPGLRQLEVLRRVGPLAVPASVCPASLDQGYAPAARALIERLQPLLE